MESVRDPEKSQEAAPRASQLRRWATPSPHTTSSLSLLATLVTLAILCSHMYNSDTGEAPFAARKSSPRPSSLLRDPHRETLQAEADRMRHRRQASGHSCSREDQRYWKQLCGTSFMRHPKAIGARVGMARRRTYVDVTSGRIIWDYDRENGTLNLPVRREQCIASCMGLVPDDPTRLLIQADGIYFLHVELKSHEHFSSQLEMVVFRKRGEEDKLIVKKTFPNTPVIVDGDSVAHHMLESNTLPPMINARPGANFHEPKALHLEQHERDSLRVSLSLEKHLYLMAGDEISIQPQSKCYGENPAEGCDRLSLLWSDYDANFIEVFRV